MLGSTRRLPQCCGAEMTDQRDLLASQSSQTISYTVSEGCHIKNNNSNDGDDDECEEQWKTSDTDI